jgi:hypothetical protein
MKCATKWPGNQDFGTDPDQAADLKIEGTLARARLPIKRDNFQSDEAIQAGRLRLPHDPVKQMATAQACR